jgi:hypothetical protein
MAEPRYICLCRLCIDKPQAKQLSKSQISRHFHANGKASGEALSAFLKRGPRDLRVINEESSKMETDSEQNSDAESSERDVAGVDVPAAKRVCKGPIQDEWPASDIAIEEPSPPVSDQEPPDHESFDIQKGRETADNNKQTVPAESEDSSLRQTGLSQGDRHEDVLSPQASVGTDSDEESWLDDYTLESSSQADELEGPGTFCGGDGADEKAKQACCPSDWKSFRA